MRLTECEQRITPAAVAYATSSAGVVTLRDADTAAVLQFRPFELAADRIPLFVALSADRVIIGAGVGGAPRVQVRDFDGNTTADFFDGDTESRTGVAVAAMQTPKQDIAPVTYGDINTQYPIFLAFANGTPQAVVQSVAFDVYNRLHGDAAVTTVAPSKPAGEYGTVMVGQDTTWYGGAAGFAPVVFQHHTANDYEPQTLYVGANLPPAATAAAITHEIGHAAGLSHNQNPNSIMYRELRPQNDFLPDEAAVLHGVLTSLA